jgi:OFA family oxalate/formate antiporter-like MFS transporter
MKNRWLIAASAVGIHICIGSVYAWSVVAKPLMQEFNLNLTEVSVAFSVAIFFLGMSAAFFGHFVEARGPRVSGTMSSIFFGLGIIGSGLVVKFAPMFQDSVLALGNIGPYAIKLKFIYLIYITYGVLGGTGLGTGYITPVSTLIKWFPDKRGMATGMAIMGFGFAAFFGGPIMQMLIAKVGIANMFLILGSIYFILMISSAQYLAPPPKGWMPVGFHESIANGTRKLKKDLASLTANESVKTIRFYYLWLMLCINITCGIAILSVASPLAQEVTGMTAMAAATMVGLMGLFNGLGRIGWSSLSDHLGRPAIWTTFFVIEIAAYFLLPNITSQLIFQVVLLLIMTCYGGAFASVPAYISDLFGTKQVSAIHGYILTAWATAGIVGPLLVSWVRDTTGSYTKTLYIFGCLFVVALTTSLLMIKNIIHLRKQIDVNPHHAPHAIETAATMPVE